MPYEAATSRTCPPRRAAPRPTPAACTQPRARTRRADRGAPRCHAAATRRRAASGAGSALPAPRPGRGGGGRRVRGETCRQDQRRRGGGERRRRRGGPGQDAAGGPLAGGDSDGRPAVRQAVDSERLPRVARLVRVEGLEARPANEHIGPAPADLRLEQLLHGRQAFRASPCAPAWASFPAFYVEFVDGDAPRRGDRGDTCWAPCGPRGNSRDGPLRVP